MRVLKSFFSLVLCLAASVVFAQVDLNNGLQAYYPFNGNANDASGHGNQPSTVNATLTNDYYGNPNSAYYFNGASGFIQIPNNASLNSNSTLSVCAWIKPQGFYKGKCHGNRIIMKGNDGGNTLGNYLLTFDDHLYTNGNNCYNTQVDTTHQTAYGYGTNITATTDTPYIRANVWHSIVYTYDGQYARLYMDCELIIETYNPNLSFTNASDLFIGKMDDPQYPYYFNGVIDEVRIYNRALNGQEIQAYSFGCAGAIQNPTLCTGSLGDPIVNITFGSGNNPGSQLSTIVPGANTTYNFTAVYGNPASPVPLDGSYTITNNIPANQDWFQGATDHTGDGNGYMAFFNANPTPGEFYKQSVTSLCPGTSYQFSAWVANVLDPNRTTGVLPDITFRIEKTDGTLVASYKTGGIPQSSSMKWTEYGFFFTTPSDGSSLVLKMINTNVGGTALPGNDFAVDDITFRACTAQLTASFSSNTLQNELQVCPNTAFTLYGDANPATSNYDYLWQVSNDNGTTWTDLPNSNKISLSLTAPSQAGATFLYRMLSSQKGNINSKNCRGASNNITLTILNSCDACSNWLYTPSDPSYVDIGNLNIAGNQITIEALINRTQPYEDGVGDNSDGDIVSKHTDPSNTNYLLRPNHAYITTTNGFFGTPDACKIDLNKTYHVAMVYDGSNLKFYRNGFLLSQTPATGNLFQNSFNTFIGRYQGIIKENFIGYTNEVRIWNVARTQSQIQDYLDKPLPNPSSQSGLLAYYTFDNLKNKQGDSRWDGTLINSAAINQSNPTCASFVADSCNAAAIPPAVIASFNAPDTVCINTNITLQNTSTNAASNYWSFCSTDLSITSPEAVNIGNPGNIVSWPVFIDLVHEGDNYYGFLVDHHPGSLIRLDFGNSLLNTPAAINLGNFNGILPADFGAEGIQMVKNNGKWYALIVGGSTQNNEVPRIIRIAFGSNILNTSPAATNWGNIGNLAQPIDLYVFYENGSWYGFSTNAENNTITRFNFGNDFDQAPTGTNLGNFNGTLNYPTGIYPINDEGEWHLFVTNYYGNSLTRLDFGNSLLNTATSTNIGNLNGTLNSPRDISIIKSCNSLIGYVVNGSPTVQELVKVDFHNNVLSTPTGTSLGNNGNYSFPHSISKLFRVGNDLYSFIPNVYNNTITRLKFPGCNSSSIPNYQGANPPQISYSSPGIYNVVLSVDEGLPTQTTYCKQIVVLAKPAQIPTRDMIVCDSAQLRLSVSVPYATYNWNTGSKDSFIYVTSPGKYWVQLNKEYDCSVTDTFNVTRSSISVNLGKDTGLCAGQALLLNAGNNGSTYLWQDGSTKSTYTATKGGNYYVRVTNTNLCAKTDTIQILNYPSPVLSNLQDKKICNGTSAQLSITANGTGNTYSWLPAATLNNPAIANPVAKPADTTNYIVAVTNTNGCISKDTATVFVLEKPVATSIADTSFCTGNSLTLQSSVSNTTSYSWSPSTGLSSTQTLSPKATPSSTTSYILTASNDGCSVSDTVNLIVYALPVITLNNDTLVCGTTSIQLSVAGGSKYQWSPATGLSNPNVFNPVATVSQPITYSVIVTDKNSCINRDSVHIGSGSLTQFIATTSTPDVCVGDSVLLAASGGDVYAWQPLQAVAHPSDSSTYAIATSSTVYSVQISNQQCKTSEIKEVAVTVNPLPKIKIVKSNDIDCRKKEAELTATGGASYAWSPLINGNNTTSAITVMPEETTVYKVTATSDKGCKSTDTVTVKVNIDLENQYPMPNAFSPNGDGINDCFGIKSWNVLKVDFEVFDQWGWLLFHSTDPSNVCWDGRYKNKNQLDGTYVYKIYAVTACGIINKAGTFVLIRAAR